MLPQGNQRFVGRFQVCRVFYGVVWVGGGHGVTPVRRV